MSALDVARFSSSQLDPKVADFYESTARWRWEVWSRWSPWFRPLGALMAMLFSRRLQQ